jgi:hypothetical protein
MPRSRNQATARCRNPAQVVSRSSGSARRELALHASTYAATQAASRAALYRLAGVRVPLIAQLAAAVVEAMLRLGHLGLSSRSALVGAVIK